MTTIPDRVKILLVDDKQENLFALEGLLENTGENLEFLQSTSGQEALKIAFFEDLALILLDVQMPAMDGYEVAQLLKANRKTRHIPIIFVTALNEDIHHVLAGYEKGAVDYLFKPLNAALTRAKVRSFIEMHLQQKEMEKLTQLVNNSMDLMCVLEDKTLRVTTFNPAWETMLGYRGEALNHQLFADVLKVPPQELSDKLAGTLAEKKALFEWEAQLVATNGVVKDIAWSLVHKNGDWFVNGKDITVRKVAEQQLAEANERLEEKVKERTQELEAANTRLKRINADLDNFIYTASHDLKSPINNVEGLMTYLKRFLPGDHPQVRQVMGMVDESIIRFKNVLKELSEVAKVENTAEAGVERIELEPLMEEVKQSLQVQIDKTNAQVTQQLDVPAIHFSKKNLRSILYNLLSNALKYHSPIRRPEIAIRTYLDENQKVVLSIEDNGLGITQENLPKIFDMFKRLHTHVEGSGVGLYLVRKMVESGDGEIRVSSELGKGTTFQVFFTEPAAIRNEGQ